MAEHVWLAHASICSLLPLSPLEATFYEEGNHHWLLLSTAEHLLCKA